jgi:hypothetical protein
MFDISAYLPHCYIVVPFLSYPFLALGIVILSSPRRPGEWLTHLPIAYSQHNIGSPCLPLRATLMKVERFLQ